MPIRIPAAAGQPYRPSNGTEGELFKAQFCDRCQLDNFNHDTGEGGCGILVRSMCFDIDHPKYPAEWLFGGDGKPTCAAFEERA